MTCPGNATSRSPMGSPLSYLAKPFTDYFLRSLHESDVRPDRAGSYQGMRRALTGSRPPAFAQDIRRDAVGDTGRGLLHRVARQMGIPSRGLDLAVA